MDYDGLGETPEGQAVSKAFRKVLTDPELRKLHDEAREQTLAAQKQEKVINYNRSVVPMLTKVRKELNALIEEWPRDIPLKDLQEKIAELRRQERDALILYRGGTLPVPALIDRVWGESGAIGRCWKCGRERKIESEELKKWITEGTPRCRRCQVKVSIQ